MNTDEYEKGYKDAEEIYLKILQEKDDEIE